MTDTAIDPRHTEAAAGRYKPLRTNVFAALSEHCTVDHAGRAADAVADLVRPELESTYAALLEANELRDEARALARALLASEIDSPGGRGPLMIRDRDLDYARLPHWLTRRPGAPRSWERAGEEPRED